MATVTIEGSVTPSVILARGERRVVQMTPRIERLIERGYVFVVPDAPAPPAPVAEVAAVQDATPEPVTPPALNASRAEWALFLTEQDIPFPDGELDEDGLLTGVAGRDDLIAIWQDHGAR